MHYHTKTEYTCAQSNIILPTRSWPLVLRGQRLVHMLLKEVLNSCRDTNSSRKTCQNAPINTQADWWRTTSWALLESALKKDTVRRPASNQPYSIRDKQSTEIRLKRVKAVTKNSSPSTICGTICTAVGTTDDTFYVIGLFLSVKEALGVGKMKKALLKL